MNDDRDVSRYGELVYRLAYAYTRNPSDADDVFQEVFLRYFRKNPRLSSEEHRKAWLIRVTVNCAKKLRTSAWNRRTVALGQSHLVFELPEENVLDEALRLLPEQYRTVIHLFYYEDLPVKRIGEVLRLRQSTVRTRLTRARAMLRDRLKEEI